MQKLIQQSFFPSKPNGVKFGLVRRLALLGCVQEGPLRDIGQTTNYGCLVPVLVNSNQLPYDYTSDTRDLYNYDYCGEGDRPW